MQQIFSKKRKKVLTKKHDGDIIIVSKATRKEEATLRTKKHKPYYTIPAYQILSRKSDDDMAKILGISKRTYKEKIEGYSDFTSEQGKVLAATFNKTQDEIFLT